jgi:hypothetical protein
VNSFNNAKITQKMKPEEIAKILTDYEKWVKERYIIQIGGKYARRVDSIYRVFYKSELIAEFASQYKPDNYISDVYCDCGNQMTISEIQQNKCDNCGEKTELM